MFVQGYNSQRQQQRFHQLPTMNRHFRPPSEKKNAVMLDGAFIQTRRWHVATCNYAKSGHDYWHNKWKWGKNKIEVEQ